MKEETIEITGVGAIQNFIEKFGFPIVVATVLLYFMINIVNVSLSDVKSKLEVHAAFAEQNFKAIEVNNVNVAKQTVLLQMICRNTAKNEYQAAQCDK